MRRLGRLARWCAVLAVGSTLLIGGGATSVSAQSGPKLSGSIRVSTAASLTDVFTKMKTDFRKLNPGTNISFNFGSSSTLVTQILNGAPADAFVSADQLVGEGEAGHESTFFKPENGTEGS